MFKKEVRYEINVRVAFTRGSSIRDLNEKFIISLGCFCCCWDKEVFVYFKIVKFKIVFNRRTSGMVTNVMRKLT